jgi:hypothetical protein
MKAVHGLLFPVLLLCIASCGGSDSPGYYTEFANPERITILGYGSDAMEPFISRDGRFLFFNDNAAASPKKDILYASRITDTIFQFKGAIPAVNSVEVDGAPAMDGGGRIYYVSIVNYTGAGGVTLYRGNWTGSTVTGIAPLSGLTIPSNLIIYFDIDVSPDGTTAYLSRGDFSGGGGVPSDADIIIATDPGSGFAADPDSDVLMASVNTAAGLEYAPAVSEDGLELFFTRYDSSYATPRIYRSVRDSTGDAFKHPRLLNNIDGFAEGPALSPDGKSLYFHRLNTAANLFEIFRVTRM